MKMVSGLEKCINKVMLLAVVFCIVTGCAIKTQAKSNSEITKVDNFEMKVVLNQNTLLGTIVENDIEQLATYDIENKYITKVNGEVNSTKKNLDIKDLGNHIICIRYDAMLSPSYDYISLYMIDKKDLSYTPIAEDVKGLECYEGKIIVSKDAKLYTYDFLNKKLVEIVLPQELVKGLSYKGSLKEYTDRFRHLFKSEDDIEQMLVYKQEKDINKAKLKIKQDNEELTQILKGQYDNKKNDDSIYIESFHKDEIVLRTHGLNKYLFNIDTKQFNKMGIDESKDYEEEVIVGRKLVVKRDGSNKTLVEVDKDGVEINVIDDSGNVVIRNIAISPANNKVVYTVMNTEDFKYRMFVYNFNLHKRVELNMMERKTNYPKWSKDSKQIYYTNNSSGVRMPGRIIDSYVVTID